MLYTYQPYGHHPEIRYQIFPFHDLQQVLGPLRQVDHGLKASIRTKLRFRPCVAQTKVFRDVEGFLWGFCSDTLWRRDTVLDKDNPCKPCKASSGYHSRS